MTNQPELAGTRPASVCSRSASGTIVEILRAAAAPALEPLARLVVEPVPELGRALVAVHRGLEVAEEGVGADLGHVCSGGAANRQVGGDEADLLGEAVLGGAPRRGEARRRR